MQPFLIYLFMQRRKFSSEFKFKVVLLAISDKYSTEQLAEMFDLDTKQINTWKRNYLSKAEIKNQRKQEAFRSLNSG